MKITYEGYRGASALHAASQVAMYYVCTKPNTSIVLLMSCEVGEGAATVPRPGRPDAALEAETWRGLDGIRGGSPQRSLHPRADPPNRLRAVSRGLPT
jgi:hypothetical protein